VKKDTRLKTYIALLLTATLMAAYAVNAFGQISGTFKFEPHWSLLAVFLLVVGGGVFDLSVETLSLLRGYLKKGEHLLDELEKKNDD
jgi:uncharacterized membrane protein YphA (DoxX/SURF4 family)